MLKDLLMRFWGCQEGVLKGSAKKFCGFFQRMKHSLGWPQYWYDYLLDAFAIKLFIFAEENTLLVKILNIVCSALEPSWASNGKLCFRPEIWEPSRLAFLSSLWTSCIRSNFLLKMYSQGYFSNILAEHAMQCTSVVYVESQNLVAHLEHNATYCTVMKSAFASHISGHLRDWVTWAQPSQVMLSNQSSRFGTR